LGHHACADGQELYRNPEQDLGLWWEYVERCRKSHRHKIAEADWA
jgi:hypothetical protein